MRLVCVEGTSAMSIFGNVWLYSAAAFVIGVFLTWLFWVRPLQKRLLAALRRYDRGPNGVPATTADKPATQHMTGVMGGGRSTATGVTVPIATGHQEMSQETTSLFRSYRPDGKPEEQTGSWVPVALDPDDDLSRGEFPPADQNVEFSQRAWDPSRLNPTGVDEAGEQSYQTTDPSDMDVSPESLISSDDHAEKESSKDVSDVDTGYPERVNTGSEMAENRQPDDHDTEYFTFLQQQRADVDSPYGESEDKSSNEDWKAERADIVEGQTGVLATDLDVTQPTVSEASDRSMFEPVMDSDLALDDDLPDPRKPANPLPEPDRVDGPIGPFGPGSALPQPDGSAPTPEFTVKARTSSMVFHTSTSPFFDRLLPQVWFRTPEDARRAGFTSWERPKDTRL